MSCVVMMAAERLLLILLQRPEGEENATHQPSAGRQIGVIPDGCTLKVEHGGPRDGAPDQEHFLHQAELFIIRGIPDPPSCREAPPFSISILSLVLKP